MGNFKQQKKTTEIFEILEYNLFGNETARDIVEVNLPYSTTLIMEKHKYMLRESKLLGDSILATSETQNVFKELQREVKESTRINFKDVITLKRCIKFAAQEFKELVNTSENIEVSTFKNNTFIRAKKEILRVVKEQIPDSFVNWDERRNS